MVYATLFAWSFLAATIVPLGSEPALIVLVRDGYPIGRLLIVATAGNYLGACTTYFLARTAARRMLAGHTPSDRERRARGLVDRYGPPAMLLSWVPLIGDVLVAVAGAAEMRFRWFSLWTIAGKAARYAAIAWAASQVART